MNKLTPLKKQAKRAQRAFLHKAARFLERPLSGSQSGSRVERLTAEQRANENFSVIPIRGYDR